MITLQQGCQQTDNRIIMMSLISVSVSNIVKFKYLLGILLGLKIDIFYRGTWLIADFVLWTDWRIFRHHKN